MHSAIRATRSDTPAQPAGEDREKFRREIQEIFRELDNLIAMDSPNIPIVITTSNYVGVIYPLELKEIVERIRPSFYFASPSQYNITTTNTTSSRPTTYEGLAEWVTDSSEDSLSNTSTLNYETLARTITEISQNYLNIGGIITRVNEGTIPPPSTSTREIPERDTFETYHNNRND